MSITARLGLLACVLAVGLAGQTLLGDQLDRLDQDRPRKLLRPLDEFPTRIGGWVGYDETPRADVIETLGPDAYIQRVYMHPSGTRAVLFINHSVTSRDAYHYPTVCMTGSGWTEQESARSRLVQSAGDDPQSAPEVPMMRFRFIKGEEHRQTVYYWYHLIGESSVDRAMRQLSRSTRLFLRGRSNAGVTVEIFSPQANGDTELLDDFARRVAVQLQDFLPRDSHAECELGARL